MLHTDTFLPFSHHSFVCYEETVFYFMNFSGSNVSLYGERFIADDGKMQRHMKTLYGKMGSQVYVGLKCDK